MYYTTIKLSVIIVTLKVGQIIFKSEERIGQTE